MGVDGVSVLFVMLTTFMMPLVIAASWNVTNRVKEDMIAFLILETLMLGVFMALDLVLFYLFFEAGLIPMFLIIGIWGGANRIYASFKFFLYTFLGSVLMLVAMVAMYAEAGTTCIGACSDGIALISHGFAFDTIHVLGIPVVGGMQTLMFVAFFASFAVKMPMWPVHTWLPDAHVQAPTAGSVVLAAILLKMGGYGFLRFSLPMFPIGASVMTDFVLWLSAIAIVYTSLVALVQEDMKKLIAYSSVAHMGFVTLGLFTMTTQGVEGGIFQMLSHGLISGALFLCVGVVYDRLHTREISRYGGIVKNMPKYATVFMILMLGSVGLPGTSGFVGEFLILLGAFQVDTVIAALAASGVILGAAYMLLLYRRVIFGPRVNDDALSMKDLNTRELGLLVPLVLMILWLGVFPGTVIDKISPSVEKLVTNYNARLALSADPTQGTVLDEHMDMEHAE